MPADDPTLFRDEVRDVTPLPEATRRAELAAPKPEPVPRPRAPVPEGEPPDVRPAKRDPQDERALFRFAIGDVTPLKKNDRAEVPLARRSAYPLHSRDRPEIGIDEPGKVLLLPDADLADPAELFRHAARGAQPVDTRNRAELDRPAPRPEPVQHREDEQAALRESLEAPMSLEDRLEMGDEAVFLRAGLPRRVLTDLRRGRWVLQGEVDLHGYNREEAREALGQFLAASLQQGRRCVRVIHGKGLGSPGKLSILKQLSRGWLAQREEILAFCQAGPYEGGSGALLVLLRAGNPGRE
ncbi:Smr/MutS family protein [Aromatoleum sp.]|uniref:Smr/MutS family protein n=1 Tax=Aromatoleum sp. TaxID=2307007 RepID=UPI002FCB4C58